MTFFFWCCTIPAGLNDTYIFYLKETDGIHAGFNGA